jgi:selenocysteine lyase/cysteine desulfurase
MYAPYGAGALIAPRVHLEDGEPPIAGGGAVLAVDIDAVHWAPPPAREEAGTPNAVGVIAMAAAARALMETGLEAVAEHERMLTARLLAGLRAIPGVTLYGDERAPTASADRVGVVPFNVAGVSHGLVAAVLGWERAIGVRGGCFCAHPFVKHLLGLTAEEQEQLTQAAITGHREELPGLVRASLGLYNTEEDVDLLLEGVRAIAAEPGAAAARFRFSPADEEYLPTATPPDPA